MERQAPVFLSAKDYPKCPHCGRTFMPGSSWKYANWCRAAFLLPYIEEHPGLSAAELAVATGLPYALTTGGLQKAREYDLLVWEAEERDAGGHRYRYSAVPGWQAIVTVRAGL